jgi:hypothetical protein
VSSVGTNAPLAQGDLPGEGWALLADQGNGRLLSASDLCGNGDFTDASAAGGTETHAAFQQGSSGPLVVSEVILLPTTDAASRVMSAGRAAIAGCHGWTDDVNGQFSTAALSVPNHGDESIGVRATELDVMSSNDIVLVRKGQAVTAVVVNWLATTPNDGVLNTLVNAAAAKL